MKLTPHIIAHLPYLAALAETGSFTVAAQQMNITQAAMSYQIKALEEKLNCTLVMRQSGAPLKLTSAGELLITEYLYCAKRLNIVLQQLNHGEGKGILKISTPVDFGSMLMPKAMAALKILAPDLHIDLHTSDDMVDLATSKWDMAIRSYLNTDQPPIYTSKICLVVSEIYKKRCGIPKTIREINKHTILMRENANHRTWKMLLAQHELTIDHIQDRMIMGNTLALKEAAKQGLGIALLPEFVVREDISEKKLTVLLPKITTTLTSNFYLSKINASQLQSYEHLLRRVFKEI
ncbi:LysR family transcriptional regulator [Cellvibrio mixtus]|uniref:LysR family transcriptional regulator n=1 Tax=Cellvibrio mixtus TaxID=39650 RepID=UPI000693E240|nr:LysR family transcriptional regulator [Cellvibrio mixtus]